MSTKKSSFSFGNEMKNFLSYEQCFEIFLSNFFYQGRGEACDPSSKLRRCQGSLYCDKTTNLCTSPELNTRCTKEAINRELVQNNSMVIYVKGDEKGIPVYFQIPYASDMDMVVCDPQDGNYELKQCRGSK